MKISKPKVKKTVLKAPDGTIKLSVSSSVRMNIDYQSAERHFGVSFETTEEDLAEHERWAEKQLERHMNKRLPELHEMLVDLSLKNKK